MYRVLPFYTLIDFNGFYILCAFVVVITVRTWLGCATVVRSKHRLKEHLRTHTQEKTMACITCGSLFANATKMFDHIQRQSFSNSTYRTWLEACFWFLTSRLAVSYLIGSLSVVILESYVENNFDRFFWHGVVLMVMSTTSASKCHKYVTK